MRGGCGGGDQAKRLETQVEVTVVCDLELSDSRRGHMLDLAELIFFKLKTLEVACSFTLGHLTSFGLLHAPSMLITWISISKLNMHAELKITSY